MGSSNVARNVLRAAAIAAALLSPAAASAQANYPAKPIELMVAFAPGGGVDLFGRTVAKVLVDEKIVTQRIQVFNKPGAGGELGMAEMAGPRKGDPYSLSAFALHVIYTPLTLGTPNSYKTLTPIAKIFSEYQMMVVRTESPIKSLKDVEAALRKDVGSSASAAPASGTPITSSSPSSPSSSAATRPKSPTSPIPAASRTRRSSAAMSMSAWAAST